MIGLVFATKREAAPFLTRMPGRGGPVVAAPGITEWRHGEQTIAVVVCGMGKPSVSAGIRGFLEHGRPERVINAGIAGALTSEVEVGGVYGVTEAVDWPAGHLVTLSDIAPAFSDLPTARLVTSDGPVFDDSARARLAAFGDMVDMEGAAIMRICAAEGVPCTVIKGISDMAGDGQREMLMSNIDKVSETLAQVVAKGLKVG